MSSNIWVDPPLSSVALVPAGVALYTLHDGKETHCDVVEIQIGASADKAIGLAVYRFIFENETQRNTFLTSVEPGGGAKFRLIFPSGTAFLYKASLVSDGFDAVRRPMVQATLTENPIRSVLAAAD